MKATWNNTVFFDLGDLRQTRISRNLYFHLSLNIRQRPLRRSQTDGAPRAGNIRDKINF